MEGKIFNIQRYSIHDGPGIRTVLFMKGCPLRCIWCSNPEGQNIYDDILLYSEKCIRCKNCVNICPENAIIITENGPLLDRKKCTSCMKCTKICPSGALLASGETINIKNAIKKLSLDQVFYEETKGGITISGGEPLFQSKFCILLADTLKKNGFNIVIETCGYGDWYHLEKLARLSNLILYDIKLINAELHKKYTGVNNSIILDNLKRLIKNNFNVKIRVPIVPKINFSRKNIMEIAEFITNLKYEEPLFLLPYHQFGVDKYQHLGKDYKIKLIKPPSFKKITKIAKEVSIKYNIKVIIGSEL